LQIHDIEFVLSEVARIQQHAAAGSAHVAQQCLALYFANRAKQDVLVQTVVYLLLQWKMQYQQRTALLDLCNVLLVYAHPSTIDALYQCLQSIDMAADGDDGSCSVQDWQQMLTRLLG
jgi:hypothetical protein